MKTILYFLSLVVYTTIAGPVNTDAKYQSFINVADNEGALHMVNLEAEPDTKFIEELERNPDNNEYYLFTRSNPTTPQRLLQSTGSIFSSNYNARNPTIISIHGWWGNLNTDNNIAIRDAFLKKSDVNVIVLDWRQLASQDYMTAVAGIPAVGRRFGQFLIFLSNITGARLNNFHIIGFSLGAHVAGNTARQLNGRVARVTGLDPAGRPWDTHPDRLRISDAIYVEGIHTDTGPNGLGIGFLTTIGDVDFYPNGGVEQPGCHDTACRHGRAWEQFAATITYDHLVGKRCSSFDEVVSNTCSGISLNMGNDNLNKWGSGIFRVNTLSAYPF